jgi:hypothetical protein
MALFFRQDDNQARVADDCFIATATAAILAASAAASAGASIYGAHKQTSASNHAADVQQHGMDAQLKFEQDNETRRRSEYDNAQALAKQQWDAEQSRRAPYRAAADALLRKRAAQLGLDMPAEAPAPHFQYPTYNPGGPQTSPAPAPTPVGSSRTPAAQATLGTLAGQPAPAPAPMAPAYQPMTPALQAPQITLRDLAQGRY